MANPNSLSPQVTSDLLLKASRAESQGDAEAIVEVGGAVGELLAFCRAGLATRHSDVAAAVWGCEHLLDGLGRTVVGGEGLQVVAGRRAMAGVLAHAYGSPARSRLALYSESLPTDGGAGSASRAAVDAELAARGVRMRAVYQYSEVGQAAWPRAGAEDVRLAALVPVNALVVDDRTAILPIDPDRPGSGLVIVSDPGWVRLVGVLAESCWAGAAAQP
ncbi:hypothetical protein OG900_09565 [Streptomyces sp. NBC_00433]